jgi:hypothetical protein
MLVKFSLPLTARSKVSICNRCFAGVAGSNLAGTWMSLSWECCMFQVEASASYLSMDRGVLRGVVCLTECDREAFIKRRP